jgi:7-cyano-7-deazaguanine synthase
MNKTSTNPNNSPTAALVVFSGGQDSTTCLYWAKREFSRVEAIAFDYGQKHRVELEQARFLAAEAEVPLTVRDIRDTLQGSALTEHDQDVSAQHEKNPSLPSSFVPGRNALFLTLAASHAYNRDIFDLVGGMCQTDYSGYPDCRRVFITALEAALSLAMECDLRIHTPLMYLTKAETWKMARDLGIVEIIREHTHTDYNGDRDTRNEWGYGKLDNPASVLRARGYQEAKAKGWV